MRIESALIVHRKSLYQIYVKEHKERSVQRAIRRRDKVALGLKQSHQAHQQALASVQHTLRKLGVKVVTRWRAHFRSTRSFDLVISLGGDGTLLDASHRLLDDTPLIGINSDPQKSIGALCCGTPDRLARLVGALRSGELRPMKLSRIRIRVDGQERLAAWMIRPGNRLYYQQLTPDEVGVLGGADHLADDPTDLHAISRRHGR